MARGENPGVVLSIESALTYDESEPFGHENAGKDLALSLNSSGKAVLATNNAAVIGTFLALDKNKIATYLATGTPMIFRKDNSTIVTGVGIIGAGSGEVKSVVAASNTVTKAQADGIRAGRGQTIEVLETADGGRIKVMFP